MTDIKMFNLKSIDISSKVNFIKIPVNNIPITATGADEFNQIYHWLKNNKDYSKITRTPSGGISIAKEVFLPPMWDIVVKPAFIEITVVAEKCYRVQFSNFLHKANADDKLISGNKAYLCFVGVCKQFGINLSDFAIDSEFGKEVKKTIERPYIKLFAEPGVAYDNVHHIDLNSSHISGMAFAYPELKPAFEHIYNKRKDNPVYKKVLTHTWGYLQSEYVHYKYTHLSKAGIAYTNRHIEELADRLERSGRKLLAFNTDGIWYQGDCYHADDEGLMLGQWKNDHTNCLFRAKSAGAYEFIENDIYTPVVRGLMQLDKVKPRDQWEWGDIFKTPEIIFTFDPDNGITTKEI